MPAQGLVTFGSDHTAPEAPADAVSSAHAGYKSDPASNLPYLYVIVDYNA
jgi:hypothetical protein